MPSPDEEVLTILLLMDLSVHSGVLGITPKHGVIRWADSGTFYNPNGVDL